MRRACAIILFLLFTQYLVDTDGLPEPSRTCGKHGDEVSTGYYSNCLNKLARIFGTLCCESLILKKG